MKKWILLLAIISSGANALETLNKLSWSAPTKRIDGAALDPSEIKEYEVRYGSYPEDMKFKSLTKTTGLRVDYKIVKPGKYCYQARTIADVASDWSEEVCKTVDAAKPMTLKMRVE